MQLKSTAEKTFQFILSHLPDSKEDRSIEIIFPFVCPRWSWLVLKLLPTAGVLYTHFTSWPRRHQLIQVKKT